MDYQLDQNSTGAILIKEVMDVLTLDACLELHARDCKTHF
jgi:hypothetical protein